MDLEALKDTAGLWLAAPGVRALIILVLSLVMAKLVDWGFTWGVARLVARTRTELDDRVLAIVHRPIFLSVFFAGLWLATLQLALPEPYARITLASLKTLAVLVWVIAGAAITRLILNLLSRRQDRFSLVKRHTLPLFDNVARIVLFGLAIYFVLLSWDIDVTAWLASAGIIGIAAGFAAKDSLANLFAGVFILADAPYKIGDFIVLDSGERGRVTEVGIRSTRLLTRDDIEITIPNAVIASAKIINETGGPWEKERIRVRVSVAYGSDIDRVREILDKIAREHPSVCADPEPRVRFRAFGQSGLEFELLSWIDEPVLRGSVLDALNSEVYKQFQQEGIEIPYPKQDVYVRQLPATD
jgi:MscS family membrane protein